MRRWATLAAAAAAAGGRVAAAAAEVGAASGVSYETVTTGGFCYGTNGEYHDLDLASCKAKCDDRPDCIGYSARYTGGLDCRLHRTPDTAESLEVYGGSFECYTKVLCTGNTYRESDGSCQSCGEQTAVIVPPGPRAVGSYDGDAEAVACECDSSAHLEDDGTGGCQCAVPYVDDGGGGCTTLQPTRMPTNSPSETPTPAPSRTPTLAPTHSPTLPTQTPTQSPTRAPTATPTQSPSQTPTQSPTHAPSETPTWSPSWAPSESPTYAPTTAPTQSPTLFGFCDDARIAVAFDASGGPGARGAQRAAAEALLDELHLSTAHMAPERGTRAAAVALGGAAPAQTLVLAPAGGITMLESAPAAADAAALKAALATHLDVTLGGAAAPGWTDLRGLLDHESGGVAAALDALPQANPVLVVLSEFALSESAPESALDDACAARESLAAQRPDVTVACLQSAGAAATALAECVCDVLWLQAEMDADGVPVAETTQQMRNAVCEPVSKLPDPCDAVDSDPELSDKERPDHCSRVQRNYRGLKTRKHDAYQPVMRAHCDWIEDSCVVKPRFAMLYFTPEGDSECWGLNRRKCTKRGGVCLWGAYLNSVEEMCFPDPDAEEEIPEGKCGSLGKGKCKKDKSCEWRKGDDNKRVCFVGGGGGGGGDGGGESSVCYGIDKKKKCKNTDGCDFGKYKDGDGNKQRGCHPVDDSGDGSKCEGLGNKKCKYTAGCTLEDYFDKDKGKEGKTCVVASGDKTPTCEGLKKNKCRKTDGCTLDKVFDEKKGKKVKTCVKEGAGRGGARKQRRA